MDCKSILDFDSAELVSIPYFVSYSIPCWKRPQLDIQFNIESGDKLKANILNGICGFVYDHIRYIYPQVKVFEPSLIKKYYDEEHYSEYYMGNRPWEAGAAINSKWYDVTPSFEQIAEKVTQLYNLHNPEPTSDDEMDANWRDDKINTYMVNRISLTKLRNPNGLFFKAMERTLDLNIKVKGSSLKNTSFFDKFTQEDFTNVRCWIDGIDHVCSCASNSSCRRFDIKKQAPAFNYNGENHIECVCEENIINKLANDWKQIYSINQKINIEEIDDMGTSIKYIIKTDKNDQEKKYIKISDGFYGI